jgi:hypothetical protein
MMNELVERGAQALQDYMEDNHGVVLKASEWDSAMRDALEALTPTGEAGEIVERIAVGVSDKVIQRLDIDEDDPRLSKIIDELRADLSTLTRIKGTDNER